MHTVKSQLKQEFTTTPFGQEWSEIIPALPENQGDQELDKMRDALQEAQKAIRAFENRIRVLEKMTLTDELTGLANRRGFIAAFTRELSLVQRQPSACGVLLMIDLDGFKSINDQWGHQTGDDYLCAVAATLRKNVRASDFVARLGGDEFAVLLTHIDEQGGMERAEALENIFNASFMARPEQAPHRIALRASFGLAFYVGGDDADTVMESADLRLYAHKGRNKDRELLPNGMALLNQANFCPFI